MTGLLHIAAAALPGPAPLKKRQLKVLLLVEDNPGDARLLREMLNEPGSHYFQLTQVESMKEAEEHLARNAVDIILLDLGLPDAHGLVALHRAHTAAPRVPLVVLTGNDDENIASQALQLGAQDFLIKGDISTRALLRALRYAVERKSMEEALLDEKERAISMNEALSRGATRQTQLREAGEKMNLQLQTEIAASKHAQDGLVEKEAHIEAALKEKDVLLGEIHHRVKNNLQIVHSLLELQCGQIQDPCALAMLRDSQNRIRSMALIHQTLYQSKDFGHVDFGIFLNSLVPTLINSYLKNPERILLSILCQNIHLSINAAVPCGLLVNELISNCLKHSFPSESRGRIDISFVAETDNVLVLTVSDNGVGIAEDFELTETTSLGLQLVFLLTDQLHGKMTVHRSRPTSFELRFSRTNADLTAPA
ncbi:MAG TPA: histidine kinase dimerization/phosphoacceptor domain -containing protein [Acidisarcina sp.]